MRLFKKLIQSLLARLGFRLVRLKLVQQFIGPQEAARALRSVREEDLVAALPELVRRMHPPSQPALADYQMEMACYNLRTGMGDADREFFPIYERCRPYTMTSWERMYSLYAAVRYVARAGIPGDFVECGVWRGGSMMVAALTLQALNATDRRLFLFDTFEGLPRPDEGLDVDVWGNRAIDGWVQHREADAPDTGSAWAYASLEEVRANLASTGYPTERVTLVKGKVEETLPAHAPGAIALLRLDTDWYESTRHELEHLYPRLARAGVLIIDDYGHFKGARKAVDEYFTGLAPAPLLARVDYSGRLAIKP